VCSARHSLDTREAADGRTQHAHGPPGRTAGSLRMPPRPEVSAPVTGAAHEAPNAARAMSHECRTHRPPPWSPSWSVASTRIPPSGSPSGGRRARRQKQAYTCAEWESQAAGPVRTCGPCPVRTQMSPPVAGATRCSPPAPGRVTGATRTSRPPSAAGRPAGRPSPRLRAPGSRRTRLDRRRRRDR